MDRRRNASPNLESDCGRSRSSFIKCIVWKSTFFLRNVFGKRGRTRCDHFHVRMSARTARCSLPRTCSGGSRRIIVRTRRRTACAVGGVEHVECLTGGNRTDCSLCRSETPHVSRLSSHHMECQMVSVKTSFALETYHTNLTEGNKLRITMQKLSENRKNKISEALRQFTALDRCQSAGYHGGANKVHESAEHRAAQFRGGHTCACGSYRRR